MKKFLRSLNDIFVVLGFVFCLFIYILSIDAIFNGTTYGLFSDELVYGFEAFQICLVFSIYVFSAFGVIPIIYIGDVVYFLVNRKNLKTFQKVILILQALMFVIGAVVFIHLQVKNLI